jgi:hypothetical protein
MCVQVISTERLLGVMEGVCLPAALKEMTRHGASVVWCGVEWCHVMSCLLAVLKEIIRHEASGSAERLSGGSRVLVEALVTVLEEGASGSTESLWSVMEQMAVRGALEGVRGVLEL